jgi:hypothetical protein
LTVNQAFKGVYLDQPGRYHIEMKYRPRYWAVAVWLFWSAAVGTLVFALMGVWRGFGHRNCGAKADAVHEPIH